MAAEQFPATELPERTDVVIIGAGIAGCSAALHLARHGIPVTVLEKGRIAGEQSSRNWGWIRMQGRDAREVPLMKESMALWRQIAEETGEATGFAQAGCLYLARDDRELEGHAKWLETARAFGIATQIVEGARLEQLLPGNAHRFRGALFTASDCRAEPATAVPAIADLARRSGAVIIEQCAVRGFETKAGRLSGVFTERGLVKCATAICAGGAWTSRLLETCNVTVPQLLARGSVARTGPAPNILNGTAWARPVALRRRQDGGYTVAHGYAVEHFVSRDSFRFMRLFLPQLMADLGQVRLRANGESIKGLFGGAPVPTGQPGPFEAIRVLDPQPSHSIERQMKRNLARYFPQLAQVPLVESWAGMIEASPDAIPVLSSVDRPAGLYVATGFSGHGFGIGPGAGQAIADLATGRTPKVDLTAFRLQRFFDGSPIVCGPGL